MKITRKHLRKLIKEELSLLKEQSNPSELYDRLVYLRNEHQGEFTLLDMLGEERYGEVIQIRADLEANPAGDDYSDYKEFFGRVKQQYRLFPSVVRDLWDERHETFDIEEIKRLKEEYDDLSGQFERKDATNTEDSMYGRKRFSVVHKPSGEVVETGLNRKGSLGT